MYDLISETLDHSSLSLCVGGIIYINRRSYNVQAS